MISIILAAVVSVATPAQPSCGGTRCACACAHTPKVSVFAGAIRRITHERKVTLEQAADMVYGLGIQGFDCPPNDPNLDALVATKLKPINFYYFASFFDAAKTAKENAFCLDQAVKYGVPRVMVIPPNFRKGGDQAADMAIIVEAMRTFTADAKKRGITVTVEDFGGAENPCSYAKYLKQLLDTIPDLCYALDSGNFWWADRGDDILEMMAYAKGRIAHVHLKDQVKTRGGDEEGKYASLGLGVIPNRKIVKDTWNSGYDGWYTLENPVGDAYIDLVRQMAVLKAWLAEE